MRGINGASFQSMKDTEQRNKKKDKLLRNKGFPYKRIAIRDEEAREKRERNR